MAGYKTKSYENIMQFLDLANKFHIPISILTKFGRAKLKLTYVTLRESNWTN